MFIKGNIDSIYFRRKHHIVTLSHADKCINFINAVANWYLSNSFQSRKEPNLFAFFGTLKLSLLGEKTALASSLVNCGL